MKSKRKSESLQATEAMEDAKKEVELAASSGQDVKKAMELLNFAQISFENKAYTQVVKVVTEALATIRIQGPDDPTPVGSTDPDTQVLEGSSDREMYKLAISSLMKCQKKLESAKKKGMDINEFQQMLESARPLLRQKQFKDAVVSINSILSKLDEKPAERDVESGPGQLAAVPQEVESDQKKRMGTSDIEAVTPGEIKDNEKVVLEPVDVVTSIEKGGEASISEELEGAEIKEPADAQREDIPLRAEDDLPSSNRDPDVDGLEGLAQLPSSQRNVASLFEKIEILVKAMERKGKDTEEPKKMYNNAVKLHNEMISYLNSCIERIHTQIGEAEEESQLKDPQSMEQTPPDDEKEKDEARKILTKVEEELASASNLQVNVVPVRNILKNANNRITEGGKDLLDDVTNMADEANKKLEELILKHHKKTSGEKLLYLKTLALESKSRGVDIKEANEKLKQLKADVNGANFKNFEDRVKDIEDGLTHAKTTHHQKSAEAVLEQAEQILKDAMELKLNTNEAATTLKDAMEAFNLKDFKVAQELGESSHEKIETLIEMKSEEIKDEADEVMQEVDTAIERFRDELPEDSPLIDMAYKLESHLGENDLVSAFVLLPKVSEEVNRVKEKYLRQRLEKSLESINKDMKDAKKLGLDVAKWQLMLKDTKDISSSDIDLAQKLASDLELDMSKNVKTNKEEQSKRADKSKKLSRSIIDSMNLAGVDVINAEILYKGLESAYADMDFKKVVEIGEEIESEIKDAEIEFLKTEAEKPLKLAESKVVFAKERGLESVEANELLEKAKTAHSSGDYDKIEKLTEEVKLALDEEDSKRRAAKESKATEGAREEASTGKEVEEVKEETSTPDAPQPDSVKPEEDSQTLQQRALGELRNAREVVMDAKGKGVDISEAEKIFLEAKPAMTEGRFEDAIEIAKRAASLIKPEMPPPQEEQDATSPEKVMKKDVQSGRKVKITKIEAYTALKSVKDLMVVVSDKGVDISKAEELFKLAQPAVKNEDFPKAYEIASEAKRILEAAGGISPQQVDPGTIPSTGVSSKGSELKEGEKKNLANTLFKPL